MYRREAEMYFEAASQVHTHPEEKIKALSCSFLGHDVEILKILTSCDYCIERAKLVFDAAADFGPPAGHFGLY